MYVLLDLNYNVQKESMISSETRMVFHKIVSTPNHGTKFTIYTTILRRPPQAEY